MGQNFTPIKGTASDWGTNREPGIRTLNEGDQAAITDLLMGHKVTKADNEHLILDNGTVIKAIGHDGGCACSAGCYDLSALNGVDNIITRVEFDYHPASDEDPYGGPNDAKRCDPSQESWTGHYRIFVFADDQRINLMQFDGSDGNGYYGTGFEILVRDVEPAEQSATCRTCRRPIDTTHEPVIDGRCGDCAGDVAREAGGEGE